MSTKTKQRANIWDIFTSLFSSNVDIEEYDYDEAELPPELNATLKSIEPSELVVTTGISATTKSGRKKDFAKPIINPKIDAAMRKQAEGVKKNKDREITE